jgi:hypothetical protein
MELHTLLEKAIDLERPIRYKYESSDGSDGERVGSPHALYAHPTTRKVACDIHQHSGASDTGNVVPFKPFLLAKMSAVEIIEEGEFKRSELYEFDAPRYVNAVAKLP